MNRKALPQDSWSAFVERITKRHGMPMGEARAFAEPVGGDDLRAAVLRCLHMAEDAGRSARADLRADHQDGSKAEDAAENRVREPVQTDLVVYLGGEPRLKVTREGFREWMAEHRISQRRAAMMAGIPSGSLQTWLSEDRSLNPKYAARLWALMTDRVA